MKFEIIRDDLKSYVESCASLMTNSAPWNLLYFNTQQCYNNLMASELTLFVAESEGEMIGFFATRAEGIEGEPLLEYMCVKHAYRNMGVGTKMIKHAEDIIFPDADNIYLFVSDINPRAINLYLRIGYFKVGELQNYNLWGQTEYLFRKFRRPRQEQFK